MDGPVRGILMACIFFKFIISASPCPPRCQCDTNQMVSCAGSNQTVIPGDLQNSTRFLYLERNNIELIRENTFSSLHHLEELVLAQNKLYEIESGAFTGLSNLDKLFLEENSITILPPGIFAPLVRLTELHLGGNRFPVIPRNLFGSMPSLERLFVEGNQVNLTIESEAFDGLGNLMELSLRSSRIQRLSHGMFSGLLNLARLDLSLNTFGSFTTDVRKDLQHLKGKRDSHTELTTLAEGTFADLKSLVDLNMSSCSLKAINRNIFKGLTSLKQLYLSVNQLRGIDEGTFCESLNLVLLELDGNPLENLEAGSFRCLYRLGYLNLNHTEFNRIGEGFFKELNELAVISLSSSGIVEIAGDAFQNKSRLTRIDLNDNGIKSFNTSLFDGTRNIRTLRLQNNQIKSLPEDIFNGVSGPLNLSLKGNPLVCDCQLDWIPGWLVRNGGTLDRCECDQPPALHGIHLDRVPYDDFHCTPYIVNDLPHIYNATPGDKRFEIVCPVSGKPPPTITWTVPNGETMSKKTVPEYPNGLYRVRENDTLVIRDISSAVEGEFTCEARNNLGHISVQIEVQVVQISNSWMTAFLVVMIVLFVSCAICLLVTFLAPWRRRRRRRELTRTPARRVDPRYGPLSPIAEGNETDEL
ncbi:leucine-rich repeat and immunoglobulin-like domain-containing nogo receptor-interacting protein 1 [Strongylocentrotus purpuratus]|uniref:Ig-like domain-containing protein n=1 Tax=Strongylocentrotus purpuratus TaxID=7668 RepID=A0A7M7GI02_STRPU|nr:leucine-rich repeat and immunoglobulin-like domain-containing nogo receptor-interacting protein 1 [Strongylocentrotus purpuratus]